MNLGFVICMSLLTFDGSLVFIVALIPEIGFGGLDVLGLGFRNWGLGFAFCSLLIDLILFFGGHRLI